MNPSGWTDGKRTAADMSSDKEILKTLLNRKCFAGKNAMLFNQTFLQYSSTTGRVVVALFRVKNTTESEITWSPSFYYSCFPFWSEVAGVALNGTSIWTSGTTSGLKSNTVALTIPANRTSTIIISSPGGNPRTLTSSIHIRTCRLVFYNDCLELPAGLEFVDDLDNASGGWEQ